MQRVVGHAVPRLAADARVTLGAQRVAPRYPRVAREVVGDAIDVLLRRVRRPLVPGSFRLAEERRTPVGVGEDRRLDLARRDRRVRTQRARLRVKVGRGPELAEHPVRLRGDERVTAARQAVPGAPRVVLGRGTPRRRGRRRTRRHARRHRLLDAMRQHDACDRPGDRERGDGCDGRHRPSTSSAREQCDRMQRPAVVGRAYKHEGARRIRGSGPRWGSAARWTTPSATTGSPPKARRTLPLSPPTFVREPRAYPRRPALGLRSRRRAHDSRSRGTVTNRCPWRACRRPRSSRCARDRTSQSHRPRAGRRGPRACPRSPRDRRWAVRSDGAVGATGAPTRPARRRRSPPREARPRRRRRKAPCARTKTLREAGSGAAWVDRGCTRLGDDSRAADGEIWHPIPGRLAPLPTEAQASGTITASMVAMASERTWVETAARLLAAPCIALLFLAACSSSPTAKVPPACEPQVRWERLQEATGAEGAAARVAGCGGGGEGGLGCRPRVEAAAATRVAAAATRAAEVATRVAAVVRMPTAAATRVVAGAAAATRT